MKANVLKNINVLASCGEHPADIMNRVSCLASFLTDFFAGDHVKPDAEIRITPETASGLAIVFEVMQNDSKNATALLP